MERLTYWNERKQHYDWHCENNEIADKLAAYEDAEEDGRLIILPCKEGTTVYCLRYDTYTDANGDEWMICDNRRRHVEERKFFESMRKDIGKNTFLTREEAESALAAMKE